MYLATFLLGYQLIKSSKIALKDNFIGEAIQSKFFGSLTQIGTPIAVLSTLLFIAQQREIECITLILYFFGYILMAAYIFVITYRIFEPFSILLFLKLLTWIKPRTQYPAPSTKFKNESDGVITQDIPHSSNGHSSSESRNSSESSTPTPSFPSSFSLPKRSTKTFGLNNIIALVCGAGATFLAILILISSLSIGNFFIERVENGLNYEILSQTDNIPSVEIIQLTDTLIIINSFALIAITLILSYFLMLILRGIPQKFSGFWIYTGVLLGMTIFLTLLDIFEADMNFPLMMTTNDVWISGALIEIELFGKEFLTMRTAFFTADFGIPLLAILAMPFNYLRSIMNFSFWAFVFFYMKRDFHTRKITLSGKRVLVELVTYTDITWSLKGVKIPSNFIVTGTKPLSTLILPEMMQPLYTTIYSADGITLPNLKEMYRDNLLDFQSQLHGLMIRRVITWWMPEFSHKYEPATLDGLYILYDDGRYLYYHNFRKDKQVFLLPALISGMFSAITSFIQEATRSAENLKTIDCGDRKVLLEYSKTHPIFVALFADHQNKEVRQLLKDMLEAFELRHTHNFKNWNGDITLFSQNDDLVQQFFGDYL